jgi:hypothetical protein
MANMGWEEGCKGIVKKVSLRPRTEKKETWRGTWSIWIRNHRKNRFNGSIDFSEVLD